MSRVGLVAPVEQLQAVLLAVADAGVVDLESADEWASATADALAWTPVQEVQPAVVGRAPLSAGLGQSRPESPHVEEPALTRPVIGGTEFDRVARDALRREAVAALCGWMPTTALHSLSDRLAPLGGAVVVLPPPPGREPPTLVDARGATGAFQPLVDTYATVPYDDLNPSVLAGVVYIIMFGMMFADVGHGALLVIGGLLVGSGHPKASARIRHLAPFIVGAGLSSTFFGLVFGETFGPTHLVPTLWMSPLDHPTTLLEVAVVAGAGLLVASYVLGTVNRWRELGAVGALCATTGGAGTLLYLGLLAIGLGWWRHATVATAIGAVIATLGLGLGLVGSYGETPGRLGGMAQAGIVTFDSVLRTGTNTISFARLAAFGLTHAALCGLVWSASTALWHRGPALWCAAGAVFLVGNALAFALEGLVAGIQALRLEYYELFSRVFVGEGRPFRPWYVPIPATKETPCSPG